MKTCVLTNRRNQFPRTITALEKRMCEVIERAPPNKGKVLRGIRQRRAHSAMEEVLSALRALYDRTK